MDGRCFDAVAQCSLVGNYFSAYVLEHGGDSRFPIDGIASGYYENYPGRRKMESLRTSFYEMGYKPLAPSQLRSKMELVEGDGRGSFDVRLLDCLFGGSEVPWSQVVVCFGE